MHPSPVDESYRVGFAVEILSTGAVVGETGFCPVAKVAVKELVANRRAFPPKVNISWGDCGVFNQNSISEFRRISPISSSSLLTRSCTFTSPLYTLMCFSLSSVFQTSPVISRRNYPQRVLRNTLAERRYGRFRLIPHPTLALSTGLLG